MRGDVALEENSSQGEQEYVRVNINFCVTAFETVH